MDKPRVLFLSARNSICGQMAEGFLRREAGDRFVSTCGALEADGEIDPLAVEVMAEAGVDISTQRPKNVKEWFKEHFSYVITLTDNSRERAPLFPFTPRLLHWSIKDPSLVEGLEEDKKRAYRRVRDELEFQVRQFARDGAPVETGLKRQSAGSLA
jgi:arsenate reductase